MPSSDSGGPGASDTSDWSVQALRDISAASYTEAVVLTDRNARVLHSELRRELPEQFGPLLELVLACHSSSGERLGLGELRIAAGLHEGGTLVCGRTEGYSLMILASDKANLGQLLSHVRRVFSRKGQP